MRGGRGAVGGGRKGIIIFVECLRDIKSIIYLFKMAFYLRHFSLLLLLLLLSFRPSFFFFKFIDKFLPFFPFFNYFNYDNPYFILVSLSSPSSSSLIPFLTSFSGSLSSSPSPRSQKQKHFLSYFLPSNVNLFLFIFISLNVNECDILE